MADPAVINDSRPIPQGDQGAVANWRSWWANIANGSAHIRSCADARAMLAESDPDLAQMAEIEIARLEPQLPQIEQELQVLLLPKDPNDEKNVVLEIRKGAGGDEASLFAAEVFRMYTRYAEEHGWKVDSHVLERIIRRRFERSYRA